MRPVRHATRHPAIAVAYRVVIACAGTGVILLGLLLVPLPGPGWPVVFSGLALLGTEFAWARRLALAARDRVGRWLRWTARKAWPVRVGVALALVLSATGPAVVLAGRA